MLKWESRLFLQFLFKNLLHMTILNETVKKITVLCTTIFSHQALFAQISVIFYICGFKLKFHIAAFWVITPCNLVRRYYCSHLQGETVQ
jgi:hypothetical protein